MNKQLTISHLGHLYIFNYYVPEWTDETVMQADYTRLIKDVISTVDQKCVREFKKEQLYRGMAIQEVESQMAKRILEKDKVLKERIEESEKKLRYLFECNASLEKSIALSKADLNKKNSFWRNLFGN